MLVMVSGAIVIVRFFEAVSGGDEPSATPTVKLKVPFAVDAPLMSPPDDSESPPGRLPDDKDHVNEVSDGVAVNCCE